MTPPMKYSRTGLHLTEQFEGVKLRAYQDSKGVWTIGYGHTRDVHEGDTITEARADWFLQSDIAWAVLVVNNRVKVKLTQDEFDALVDFTFNAGSGHFDGSTLLQDVNAGQFEAAAAEFEKWDKCGGLVVAGLLRRRVAEAKEFETVA